MFWQYILPMVRLVVGEKNPQIHIYFVLFIFIIYNSWSCERLILFPKKCLTWSQTTLLLLRHRQVSVYSPERRTAYGQRKCEKINTKTHTLDFIISRGRNGLFAGLLCYFSVRHLILNDLAYESVNEQQTASVSLLPSKIRIHRGA